MGALYATPPADGVILRPPSSARVKWKTENMLKWTIISIKLYIQFNYNLEDRPDFQAETWRLNCSFIQSCQPEISTYLYRLPYASYVLFLNIPVSSQCCDKTKEQLKAVLLASASVIPSLWVVKLIRLFSSTMLYCCICCILLYMLLYLLYMKEWNISFTETCPICIQ